MTFKVLGGMAPNRRCGATAGGTLALLALMAWGCGGDGSTAMPGAPDGGVGTGVPPVRDGGSVATPTPPTPGQPGMAVAKFCNGLRRMTGPIEFVLEVGTPPVRFVAGSGKCTPPAGQPCTMIQAGPSVNVNLFLDGTSIGTGSFEVPVGQDVVFEPTLVMMNGMQGLSLVGSVYPPGVCPDIDLIDVGDGGMPPANPDAGASPPRPGI